MALYGALILHEELTYSACANEENHNEPLSMEIMLMIFTAKFNNCALIRFAVFRFDIRGQSITTERDGLHCSTARIERTCHPNANPIHVQR